VCGCVSRREKKRVLAQKPRNAGNYKEKEMEKENRKKEKACVPP
jgi:hypothetical protein